jgi:hypothetical protein
MEYEEYETLYLEEVGAECAPECADCHMPTYVDRLTQGHLLSYIHPKRPVHDHSFPLWTEAITAGSVEVAELDVRRLPDGQLIVDVVLVNRGAGHRIPTGEFGHNEVRLLVQVLSGSEEIVGESEVSIFAGDDEALAPGRRVPFTLPVTLDADSAPMRIELNVEAVDEDRTFRHSLVQRSLEFRE